MNSLDLTRLDIELCILRAATRLLDDADSCDICDICAAREAAREGRYDYALYLLEKAQI